MGAEDIEKLVAQCKSNDIDAKVDALNKLQPQFEEATELSDVEGVIAVLKSCLRTSNQLLTAATLAVIPSFIRIISSSASQAASGAGSNPPTPGKTGTSPAVQHLRHAIVAFLPPGGVVDRLGEQREKARDSARLALVEISGAAFQSSPPTVGSRIKDVAKGHETPLALVEKYVKELGLGSKVARVREQTTLALVEVRRDNRTFPIRPYLPQLVECLEDPDANVRECTRSSIVALFTGPQVSDAARADLKNEMAKKGVRKGIVNDVLSKLMSASTTTSNTPDASEPGEDESASSARVPTRKPNLLGRSVTAPVFARTATTASTRTAMSEEVVASPSTEIPDVYIASARDLEHEFSSMVPFFEGRETEHNWLDRERSVIRLRGMVRGDVNERYPDMWFSGLKGGILESTLKALLSLRTTVASHACALYSELAAAMGPSFDPLIEVVLTHLLKMGGFTKKIVAQQSQVAVTAILTHTSATPRLVLPLLWSYAQEKTVQVRAYMVGHFKTMLEIHARRPTGKAAIEASGGLDTVEKAIKRSLGDPNPGVREQGRSAFWVFHEIWPANAATLMGTLDNAAKTQLQKANPNPGGSASAATAAVATPAPKKSSVAAAIAASRAKAKVLATAPPTLRHAATSGASAASKAALPRREGSPAATSVGRRAVSPVPHPRVASPVSPRSGLASPPTSRSASPPVARPINNRSSTTSAVMNGAKVKSTANILNSPPARLPRTQSISPPSSPTPLGSSAAVRRIASPLIPLGRSTAKSGRSGLGQSTAAPFYNLGSLRDSIVIPAGLDEECITAMQIPLPPDSEDDEDDMAINRSMNLMSFSTAWEKVEGSGGGTVSSALSTPAVDPTVPESVIHDNYRAQAEQAESAAAQLLELVHDDDIPALNAPPLLPLSPNQPPAALPPAPTTSTFLSPGSEPATKPPTSRPPPVTPKSRVSSLAQALKDFKNSPPPASSGQSSLMNRVLFERNDKTGVWWRMRRKALANGPPSEALDEAQQLEESIAKLENGSADAETLKILLFICSKHPSTSRPSSPVLGGHRASSNGMLTPTTPSPLGAGKRQPAAEDIWQDGKALDSLLLSLTRFLNKDKSADLLDYGLMVLYEMVFNQSSLLTGHESLVFSFLLEVRYAKKLNVFEATNAIRDVLIEKCDPIMGLATVHRGLEDFLKRSVVDETLVDARTSSYCFALVALAKLMLLLPPEVLEDELPRLKNTLITALSDSSSASIREAAYVTIISAQMKLRDERQLFTILSGLSETQKHLLTYEFEKIKVRGPGKDEVEGAGLQKL
ncbi:suppressor of tub2 mutation, partial [Tulasnella sp. 427]